jgi:hypothetical protein
LVLVFAAGCGRVDLDIPDVSIDHVSPGDASDAPSDAPDAMVCPPKTTACSGKCVDLLGDSKNCGKCGTVCNDPQVCAAGLCSTQCPIGRSKCGTSCVDTLTDPQNCGGCGIACTGSQSCLMGNCCEANETLCNGKCVNTQTDKNNCGMCGKTCTGSCTSGQCCDKPPTGMCPHALCDMGSALTASCDGNMACVDKICSQDAFCCDQTNGAWDSLCVGEVDTYCGPAFSCMCK